MSARGMTATVLATQLATAIAEDENRDPLSVRLGRQTTDWLCSLADELAARAERAEAAQPVASDAVPLTAEDVSAARNLLFQCSSSAILSGDDDEARQSFADRAVVYRLICEANNLLIGETRAEAAQRVPLTDAQLRAEYAKAYPDDDDLLDLARNNRDYAVEAIGARNRWRAFEIGARAIEAAHGIGGVTATEPQGERS